MRTEIVYADGAHYRRATFPRREHAQSTEARKGLARLPEPVVFIPSHVVEAHSQSYVDFNHPERGLGIRRVPKQTFPDAARVGSYAARVGSCRYYFERGVCKRVRVISVEHQMALNALDEGIAELERQRRELVEDAYARGRYLRAEDIRDATAAYREEKRRLEEKKRKESDQC